MPDKLLKKYFGQYYNRCLLYARSYVFDKQEAESIVSEAFCVLWQKSLEKSFNNEPLPFLFATIRNKALNYLRSQIRFNRMKQSLSDIALRELKMRTSQLESADPHMIYYSEIVEVMEETLDSLGKKTSDVFKMSRSEGLSYKEIAVRLGISVKAVEYHISVALRALKHKLKDYLL
jgi:RNA polymerase sigma-70 factor (ECF subfamily)